MLALACLLPPQTPAPRTVVFLGDSLTAGYGLSPGLSFPGLLEARMRREGLGWKVVNAGVSGDTTAGVLARLDQVFRQGPDLVFLCIGSNDGLRGMPIPGMEKNLRAILDRARGEGVPVVLAGALLPEAFGREYRDTFRLVFPRLAMEYGLPFLPFLLEGVALKPGYVLEDGLHPNAAGTRQVAENVWKVLEPELRRGR
jgi:acyl-CoA thioesterase-1